MGRSLSQPIPWERSWITPIEMWEVAIVPTVPHNQNKRCNGKSVKRHDRQHHDKALRGQPILDEDGRRQYQPCGAWAMHGSDVCNAHGGNAPQVIAAAKKRLALATENIALAFEQIALDERLPPEVRIKAGKEIMDRAGIRGGVDIELDAPKWQQMLGRMFGTATDDEEPAPATPEPPAAKKPPARKASAKPRERPKFEGWD